jgi:CRISPR/Cas system CSM-associated protein Csm3 (group 7 of RAMP superfamily)
MSALGRFGAFKLSVEVELALRAEGPILVRGPDAFVPDAPDMAFIRLPTAEGEVPYLPGSSLKGVLRAGAEMLLRGMGRPVCDPTTKEHRGGCGDCEACRTFGSSKLGAAVVLVGDGMPWAPDADAEARRQAVEEVMARRGVRTAVAIDRRRGSVAAGPFDMEVLADVTFYPSLLLRNPEPDQLRLVAAALDLLDRGLLRVGSGTTRGLGRVRARVTRLLVRCLDPAAASGILAGLRARQVREGVLWRLECEEPEQALTRWASLFEQGGGSGAG